MKKSLVSPATVLLALTGVALAGSPRASSVYPSAAQRGIESEIEFRGDYLTDVKTVMFDEPGFEVVPGPPEKTKFKAKVKVAPTVRLGEHTFRIVTTSGVSDVRLFYVTPFPVVEEVEDKENPKKAFPIALGTTVTGRTSGEDQDSFEIEAKKGQRISAEVIGARLQTGTLFDPYLSITKADGSRLTEVDDTAFTQQDPVASIVAPEDGKYVLSVKDSTNSGQGECQYLLNVGSFPRPLAVYPAGGPTGQELKVKLLGDASGPLEKTIKLPDQPDDRFEVFSDDAAPAPQPNYFRVSTFPNVLEAEPNNDPATAPATADPLPLAFNGIVGEKGDLDTFKFTAKKGQAYDVTVWARRLRSPLDAVLSIYDAKGNRIVQNDDSGSSDSYLRWTAPADGEFVVGIEDQLKRGGPTFTYRVEVTPMQPNITMWLPEMVQNSNQERRAIVVPKGNRYASLIRVKRNDIGGEIQLTTDGLPAGVTANGLTIDKSTDTIPVVFEAAADAALAAKPFGIKATTTEAPKDAPIKSAIEQEIDIIGNGNQKPYYSIKEGTLAAAVTDEIPVKLGLLQPKAPLLQNGSVNLKVTAERKGDFKGAISLTLLYSPPGIGSAGTVQIKEGENEGIVPLSANANAALQKWKICVVGSADFGKGVVWFSTPLIDLEIAPPFMAGQIVRTFVDQGDSTTVKVKLENKIPFEGKAKLSLLGLPPNTTADEKEITKDDKEVTFTVKADATAPAALHKQLFCQFQLTKDGDTMTSSFAQGGSLRVDKASVAKATPPKP